MKLRSALAATAITAAVSITMPVLASNASPAAPSGAVLAGVRGATARFHDVSVAVAAGYVPVSPCESSVEGGMGIHYLHPGLASDLDLDPVAPEVLLYEPSADGLRLVGVEWWVADVGQPAPEVHGLPLDGPMAGHSPDMPQHYDLHLWVWRHNPSGVTSVWNPKVNCTHEEH
jgi:hypothetical protein